MRFARVGVRAGSAWVLRGISFDVCAGERIGLVGPNGAGKTTLLHLCNGFRRPHEGTVEVFGSPVAALRGGRLAALRRRIAYVPQVAESDTSLPLRAREVVEMGRSGARGPFRPLTAADRQAVRHWMERLGIAALADRLYRELSGGERQKVHLARAMAQGADLLLLDEPTNHLDPRSQEALSDLVDALCEDVPLSFLYVTHEIRLLPRRTGRVLVLSGGRLLADGPPQRVLDCEVLGHAYGAQVEVIERGGRRHLLLKSATVTDPPAREEAGCSPT